MMKDQSIDNIEFKYGKTGFRFNNDLSNHADLFLPHSYHSGPGNANDVINSVIQNFSPAGLNLSEETTVGITVNDPTRPIPNNLLLPPLLDWLHKHDVTDQNITLYIATGTHKGLSADEIKEFLPGFMANKYRTLVHNCDDRQNLVFLGVSSAGTPIRINKNFYEKDVKIVVGHIEPHHFMGYSGGVKSAVIGLGGRETISTNHKMLTDPACKMGNFYKNPMRIDIEDMGKKININLALNVILDDAKNIIEAFFGTPYEVMEKGIRVSEKICQVKTKSNYDLVICSAGGFPKDINLYQAQKAITHACTFLKDGGVVILIAECSQGLGSAGFEQFFEGKASPSEVIKAFEEGPFTIGPHKAYQLSIQTEKHKIIFVSEIQDDVVRKLFLEPAKDLRGALNIAKKHIPENPNIALLPFATHIMNQTGINPNEKRQ